MHTCVESAFAAIWPSRADNIYNDTRPAPPLSLVAADAGRVPRCAQSSDSTVLFVHLAGHMRSFANNTAEILDFLDATASCWFVIMFTLEHQETRRPWWCGTQLDTANSGGHQHCYAATAKAASASVADNLAAMAEPLRSAPNGGFAYAVGARAFEPLVADTAILQNFAAVTAADRCVLTHHGIAPQRSDIILQSRPDVLYGDAIDFSRLATLGARAEVAASLPLLLLLRHGATAGLVGIGGKDPSEVTWLATRSALDLLCAERGKCLGVASALGMKRRFPKSGCGHPFVSLLVHSAVPLGVGVFFVEAGWKISLRRTHGDNSRNYNGGEVTVDGRAGRRRDLTLGLRCAVGHNHRNESACVKATEPLAQTRWGLANMSTSFAYGARYFLCMDALDLEGLVLRAAAL